MAFISSSKCTNEESYLMQKLARAVVGTNNIDNCSRYCQSPATMGLFRTVGYGGDSGSISDIEKAGLVLIVGSNTAESHPVLATRVKRAQKLRGQKLIVSDLRENEMARRADVHAAAPARNGHRVALRRRPIPSGRGTGRYRVPGPLGQRPGGVSAEPGAVHTGGRIRRPAICRWRP